MSVYFDGKLISTDISSGYATLSQAKGIFSFTFIPMKDEWYTAILYDKTRGYLHYLAMNIDGNDPDNNYVVMDYMAPSVISGTHEFILLIYAQPTTITRINKIESRSQFSPSVFSKLYDLEMHQKSNFFVNPDKVIEEVETKVIVTPLRRTYVAPVKTVALKESKNYLAQGTKLLREEETSYVLTDVPVTMFKSQVTINDDQMRYCACLIKLAEQQPGRCHMERAFFEEGNKAPCVNYFEICENAIGTSTLECFKNFDLNGFTMVELQTLAHVNKIDYPLNATRVELIKILDKWRAIYRK